MTSVAISVVIPAFNEEGAVGPTVTQVRETLSAASITVDVVVVDDGSTDATAAVAEAAGARVIRKPQNIGYGHSLKVGIEAAAHDTIVITDADATYPIDQIPKLVDHYLTRGFDMVVGARTGEHYRESWLKAPLRAVLKWLVEFTTGLTIPDINSGMRVFSRQTIKPFLGHLCDTFSFTTSVTLAYMLCRKYVDYIDIPYHKRMGTTKVRLFRDTLRTLQYIVQAIIYYNPLKIFLLLSVLLVLMGLSALVLGGFGMQGAGGIAFQSGIGAVIVFGLGLLADLIRQIMIRDE